MDLKFYKSTDIFYKNGVLDEEPEESLEELLAQYDEMCKSYHEFRKEQAEKEKLYKDYDEWEEKDPDGFFFGGLAEFNAFNAIDMMQYEIDLKITHLNLKEQNNGDQ